MIGIRRLSLALAASAALAVAAAPANAATPFKARYKPLDTQIHAIGLDLAKELKAASNQNDREVAVAFAMLAQRAAKSAVDLQRLQGAPPAARRDSTRSGVDHRTSRTRSAGSNPYGIVPAGRPGRSAPACGEVVILGHRAARTCTVALEAGGTA